MAPVIKAEVTLASLKNCLVNLPANLIALLANANTPPQNVIVELQYKVSQATGGAIPHANNAAISKSAFVGWTGMPSRSRPSSLLAERSRSGRDLEVQSVEIDAIFAKTLGLSEGQKVGLLVHLDPPVANTINIEPVTSADWEAIELHANFLELNMLSQVRALPNPIFRDPSHVHAETNQHALTLHLSPSTTANVIVTSMTPAIPASVPFAKIAPDSEVIVAPKTRQRLPRATKGDTRSVASQRSKRSGASGRTTGSRKSTAPRNSILLRGIDVSVARDFLPIDGNDDNLSGLQLWMSKANILSDAVKGASFASVSIVKPAGLRAQLDQTQMERLKEEEYSDVGRPAGKIVTRVLPWSQPLDDNHVLLSPALAAMLALPGMTGLVVRVEGVDQPLSRYNLKSFVFFPFLPFTTKRNEGLKFGGDSKAQKQALIDRLRITHGGDSGLLSGPLTDGMILLPTGDPSSSSSFSGGILRLQKSEDSDQLSSDHIIWALGGEHKQDFEVRAEIPRPMAITTLFPTFEQNIILSQAKLIGVDVVLKQCLANLTLCSSTLLTGGIGSGKSAISQWLGTRLREDYLFNVTYFSCQKLVTDETRVSTIKETLTRLFMSASWCARLGGHSVIILDDVDKICPEETELQVGNDNGRSRQVTEIVCSLVRQYCSIHSGVALLATAQSKDNLNNLIIGGHIVGDIVSIKSPNKEVRRDILSHLLAINRGERQGNDDGHSYSPADAQSISNNSWMNPSEGSPRPGSSSSSHIDGFRSSPTLDLLDIAGKTDGYMPADLHLLASRARNQCLIRTLSATQEPDQDQSPALVLNKADFDAALENFTPTSLRNVTLTHSTTTFSAIGGLKETRDTLLETLLYPTKYAPIFAASPLRLRSGLLLYGYPGCGKTLLASAVAGECGLNFISVKGPEILNKYIGASEKSVRDLFERAQAAKPCVLFFDEFDSIAPKRGHDSTGVTDRVVNQMLTQMDGAEGLDGVYVLAATSRPDLIDPALLRPGRLDKSLLCDMPRADDRVDILRAVSEKLHLSVRVANRLDDIAAQTEGFSGADLQALMYNAHLEAIHDLLGDQSPSHSNQSNQRQSTQSSSTRSSSVSSTTSNSSHRSTSANGTSVSRTSSRSSLKKPTTSKTDDFIQFIYSPSLDAAARNAIGSTPSGAKLDPRAVVAAKLEEMKLNRKREKELLRPSHRHASGSKHNDDYHYSESPTSTATPINGSMLSFDRTRTKVKNAGSGDSGGGEQVVIEWKHIEKSLASTRSSISPQERQRLQAIYQEFVVGRNGEMPSGQGGTEVGGRSSLA